MLALTLLVFANAAAFAPSPDDEARRAERLFTDGRDYDALLAFVELARAHPDDPRSAGWLLDAVRPAQRVLERRLVAALLEEAVAAAARERAVDLDAREPMVRALVGGILEETAYGCSAFHDTRAIERVMEAYVELFPASPYVGDVLLARAQRGLWRGTWRDDAARPWFAAAATYDFPNAAIARACALDTHLPACAARVDAGRLITRAATAALEPTEGVVSVSADETSAVR